MSACFMDGFVVGWATLALFLMLVQWRVRRKR